MAQKLRKNMLLCVEHNEPDTNQEILRFGNYYMFLKIKGQIHSEIIRT